MSDARAKSEARRAKILARENKSKISAVLTEEEDLLLSMTMNEPPKRERPLAARRSLIQSKTDETESTEDAVNTAEDKEDKIDEVTQEPKTSSSEDKSKDESLKPETSKKLDGESTDLKDSSKPTTTPTKENSNKELKTSTSSSKFPPAKSMEEIEKEVAENTSKFDKKTLGKDDENDDGKKKRSIKQKLLKGKNEQKHYLEPNSVMRLIRVLLIVCLGAFTGYQTVQTSRLQALQSISMSTPTTTLGNIPSPITAQTINPKENEFDEFGTGSAASTPPSSSSTFFTAEATQERSWMEWIQEKIRRNLECSVSAVGVVWWGTRMLNPMIHAQFKAKPQQVKPLEMVMNFLTNGMASVFEGVYGTLGEVSLHLMALLFSVVVFTILFSSATVQDGVASSASSAAAVVTETVTAEL